MESQISTNNGVQQRLSQRSMLRAIAKNVAGTVPPIARIVAQRDHLLAEVDRLTLELTRLRRVHEEEVNRVAAQFAASRPVHQADDGAEQSPTKSPGASILDAYVSQAPSRRTAFNIFKDEWSSNVPSFGLGGAGLFADDRIEWLEQKSGGFAGKKILELGPLEGGHTFMMATRGAAHILAIESNTRAFLKCLIVKDILGFDADILLGDFRQYLKSGHDRFDFVLASGVLYHMSNPVDLLSDLSQVTDAMGVWTHYYDQDVINSKDYLRMRFDQFPRVQSIRGRDIVGHEQFYLDALGWQGFCGGSAPSSCWLTKESIIGALIDLGFTVEIGRDDPDHPNGPSMLFLATRRSGANG